MNKAYATSGKIFAQVSKRVSPGLVEQLDAVGKGEIVVVRGVHDHVETLLDTMKIPYTMIESGSIKTHNGGRVMIVNCAPYETGVPASAVSSFVENGGRLVTTDWALDFAAKSFPGKLYKTGTTGNDVVEVRCAHEVGRKLIGMNYAQCHPKWWLEGSSYVYKTGEGVIDLITSNEMKDKYGQPHVAVGFTHGAGEVFHFISHLELQRSRQDKGKGKSTLEDFLKKMDVERTDEMEDASFAELEAAYSTLNTLAYLCAPAPILRSGSMSYLLRSGKESTKGLKKSTALLKE